MEEPKMVRVTYIEYCGTEKTVNAQPGETVMQTAVNNEVTGILGDCGGALSCSTCHVYITSEWQEKVGPPGEAEQFMLELAVEPEKCSRLSCQIAVTPALDGLVVRVPVSQL
jgi:2Fe-2S ferredoxin